MKTFKTAIAIILSLLLLFSITACNGEKSEGNVSEDGKAVITAAFLKGPTGVGAAYLMQKSDDRKTENNYNFILASSADEISGKIVSGEINIASVPTNLAAKLYAKTGGKLIMLAANTLSVLSVIENGDSIGSFADLKGKTIYAMGEGSNPEYILRFLLEKNGIDSEKDVTIKFVATSDELAAQVVSGNAAIAVAPEPVATTLLTKKSTLRRALCLGDEWERTASGEIVMGCVVALKSFVESNREAVDNFLSEYEASVKFAEADNVSAASLCEKYGIIPSAAIAERSIAHCGLTYIKASEVKPIIEPYFEVLKSYDPSSIGGELPDESFYY